MHAYMIVRIASIRTKRSKSRVQAEKEGERGKVGRRHLCTRSTSCYKVNVIAAVAARYSLLATKHGKPRALPGKLPAGDNAPFGGPPPDASRPPNPHPLPSTPHDRLEIPADVTIAARREEGTTHASGRGGEGGEGGMVESEVKVAERRWEVYLAAAERYTSHGQRLALVHQTS